MPFTITRNLERLPSYPMLCRLAGQKRVNLSGNEFAGSFACRGLEGDYEFDEDGIHGRFRGHGVTGEFSLAIGRATLTITEKPFWLPEMLLKQKIAVGLDAFCAELV